MATALRITDLDASQRPRERLSRLGPRALTDTELLAILVGSGHKGASAIDVGHDVIAQRGGLSGVSTALRLIDTVIVTEGASAHASVPISDILHAVLIRNGSAFTVASARRLVWSRLASSS